MRNSSPENTPSLSGTIQFSHKLNRSDALWQLLSDQQLATNLRQTLRQAASATAVLQASARDMQQLTHGVRQGRGPAGYLLTDTEFAGQLRHTTRQLARSSDTLAATLGSLRQQVQRGHGPVPTLLTDTVMSRQLRQTDPAQRGAGHGRLQPEHGGLAAQFPAARLLPQAGPRQGPGRRAVARYWSSLP